MVIIILWYFLGNTRQLDNNTTTFQKYRSKTVNINPTQWRSQRTCDWLTLSGCLFFHFGSWFENRFHINNKRNILLHISQIARSFSATGCGFGIILSVKFILAIFSNYKKITFLHVMCDIVRVYPTTYR